MGFVFGGSAVIPTAQYQNVSPSFEIEADTFEEARDLWLKEMRVIHEMLGKPLEVRGEEPAPSGKVLQCRVSGAEILFDEVAHTYHDRQGNRYMGGSTFASKYKAPFPAGPVSERMAAKAGVEASEIRAMWALNAEASSAFGTGVHAALQLYGEYLELSKKVKGTDESALTKNPTMRDMVLKFFTPERAAENAYYEELVLNPAERAAGLIDRLVVEPDGLWVEDFKTNADVETKEEKILPPFAGMVPNTALGSYIIQLSYYSRILQAHGRNVKGVRIHHWTGEDWKTYEHDVIDLSPAFEGVNQ